MPNIDDKLAAILEAKYGEAVRGSIHDAIEEINEVVENWESGLMDTTLTSTTLPAQAKAAGDAVAATGNKTEAISEILSETLGNDPTYLEQGSVNTNAGTISDNSKYVRTCLTSVEAGTTYTIYLNNKTSVVVGAVVVFYKADKSYLSANTSLGNKPVGNSVFTITPPTNAAYLRFRFNKSGNADIIPSELDISIKNELAPFYGALISKGNISTANLDLNTGDFIHPGMWNLLSMDYAPDNWPSSYIGKVISFATPSNSTFSTAQVVIDNVGQFFYRYSTANESWLNWVQVENKASSLEIKNNTVFNYGNIAAANLDLNTGDFIHPGMWSLLSMDYAPDNWPSTYIGKVISFATPSNSSFSTVQIVIDNVGQFFYRYSTANESWLNWVQMESKADVLTIKGNTIFNNGNVTTAGLDLNTGDFIHPGMWAVNDPQYTPKHSPTNKRCRIISFASSSDNSIYTYQVIIDSDNIKYSRFSTNTNIWSPWVCDNPYNKLSYKPMKPIESFEVSRHTSADNDKYTMIWGNWDNRVSRLIAMYDGESNPNGYSITKSSLGKDATGTFDVLLYKVSLGYTNQSTKPVVLLIVGEHGNEPASAMTGYYAYKEILDGKLSKYLKYVDFWLVPLMNPYGYENNTRNNGNDVNLNRDFPANWNYARDGHNDTGDYSMSQTETNYIINLVLNNRNRILFVCNKHDTGSIGRKLQYNEVDTVGYLTTCMYTDSIINESICEFQDLQTKETDPYIVSACSVNLSKKQLIVNNSPHPLDGSLDLFLNAIGVHASLLEGSYGFNDSGQSYYDPTIYTNVNYATSQIRYITDFFVNYIGWTIDNCVYLESSDRTFDNYKLKSRKYNSSSGSWENIELWFNGTSFVEV